MVQVTLSIRTDQVALACFMLRVLGCTSRMLHEQIAHLLLSIGVALVPGTSNIGYSTWMTAYTAVAEIPYIPKDLWEAAMIR